MYGNTRHAVGGKALCGRKGCAEVPKPGQCASAHRKEQTEEATLYDYLIGELTRGRSGRLRGSGGRVARASGASALIVCCSLVYRLFEDLQSGRYPNSGSGIVWAWQRDSSTPGRDVGFAFETQDRRAPRSE